DVNPIERNPGVATPTRECSVVPVANGRRHDVNLRRLELFELSRRALVTRDTRDERDVGRALNATEECHEALQADRGDIARRSPERLEERHERPPRLSCARRRAWTKAQGHVPARLQLTLERRGREVRRRDVQLERLLVVDLPVERPELGVLDGARLRADVE